MKTNSNCGVEKLNQSTSISFSTISDTKQSSTSFDDTCSSPSSSVYSSKDQLEDISCHPISGIKIIDKSTSKVYNDTPDYILGHCKRQPVRLKSVDYFKSKLSTFVDSTHQKSNIYGELRKLKGSGNKPKLEHFPNLKSRFLIKNCKNSF